MKKPKDLAKAAKENADLVLSLLGFLGLGSAVALFEDARAVLCEHPVASALLCLASACAGYALATGGRWAKQRRKEETLARVFASLSDEHRALVAKALDDGAVDCWVYDPVAVALMDAHILGCPSVVSRVQPTKLSVQPSVVLEIKRHREEWLGM